MDIGASCVAIRKIEVGQLKMSYDNKIYEEFIGYGFGHVKALGPS